MYLVQVKFWTNFNPCYLVPNKMNGVSFLLKIFFTGFLYMSSFLHQWLTATQYIAPLMANFDLRIGATSDIHYVDNSKYGLESNCLLKDDLI